MTESTAVLVFARAPVAGAAKTRLMPALGADGAARASAALTRRALRTAVGAGIGPVELWCAPDCSHPFFADCARDFGVTLHAQSAGDVGQRMAQAFDDALSRHARVVLIGADAVSLQTADLAAAATALRDHDAAFAPAEDGGYLLVALRSRQPALFDGPTWGTPSVWTQTRARLDALGLRTSVLPTGYDVDHPADWQRALREGLLEGEAC
ncbi:MAG: TIGR04282 family arsenosugar biosynthesis glycosyltransferase [Methyloversatilis sp.]|jgi:rSAM/selenodomain-associated transferase 1|nr:TIGR04282 family arsenosugar biosynthesis glycosyltransferase [Methyloversatilis sp.]